MQHYIHIASKRYPLTPAEIMAENPDTLFPVPFSAPDGYAPVIETDPASFDPAIERLELDQPEEVAGEYRQVWRVVQLTPQEIEANRLASVPTSCTRRQGRLALLAHGHLDDVEALIAAIADPAERRAAQIEYEADTWERSNPTVQAMWSALGGTSEQLDDLFVMAVTL